MATVHLSSKSNHPSYSDMAVEAIKELKEKKGSSKIAILNFAKKKYQLETSARVNQLLNKGIVAAVEKGLLIRKSGVGANGRFRVAENKKVQKPQEVLDESANEKTSKPKAVAKKPIKTHSSVKSPKRTSATVVSKTSKKPAKQPDAVVVKKAGVSKVTKSPAQVTKSPAQVAKSPAQVAKSPKTKSDKKTASPVKKVSKKAIASKASIPKVAKKAITASV